MLHFKEKDLFYFFNIWVSSIAARCRTVLAEYNMSCDDVSGRIFIFVVFIIIKVQLCKAIVQAD